MKRVLLVSVCIVLYGALVANADFITVTSSRSTYGGSVDQIVFTLAGLPTSAQKTATWGRLLASGWSSAFPLLQLVVPTESAGRELTAAGLTMGESRWAGVLESVLVYWRR